MGKLNLRGVLCPLATPFDHRGELYPAKIRSNIARLERTRLAGFIAGDECGEGSRLRAAERCRLFGLVREAVESERLLLAAVTSESAQEAIDLGRCAAEMGYQGLLVRPVRSPEHEKSRLAFLRSVADAASAPVIVAIDDQRTLAPATAAALAAHPQVAGFLDDRGDAEWLKAFRDSAPASVPVATGRETSLATLWELGVTALAAPLANAIPFFTLSIEEALRTREGEAAVDLIQRAQPAFDRIWPQLGPAGLKRAMDLRGAYGGVPRLPYTPLAPALAAEVEQLLEGLSS